MSIKTCKKCKQNQENQESQYPKKKGSEVFFLILSTLVLKSWNLYIGPIKNI